MSNYPDNFTTTNMETSENDNEELASTRQIATGNAMLAGHSRHIAHALTEKYFDCLKATTPEEQLKELEQFNKFLASL